MFTRHFFEYCLCIYTSTAEDYPFVIHFTAPHEYLQDCLYYIIKFVNNDIKQVNYYTLSPLCSSLSNTYDIFYNYIGDYPLTPEHSFIMEGIRLKYIQHFKQKKIKRL